MCRMKQWTQWGHFWNTHIYWKNKVHLKICYLAQIWKPTDCNKQKSTTQTLRSQNKTRAYLLLSMNKLAEYITGTYIRTVGVPRTVHRVPIPQAPWAWHADDCWWAKGIDDLLPHIFIIYISKCVCNCVCACAFKPEIPVFILSLLGVESTCACGRDVKYGFAP